MMKFIKMFLALVGLAVLFVFVRDNAEPVTVKFWGYATPEIELFLILIITFVLGMLTTSFGSTLKIIQLKRQLKNAGSGDGVGRKEVEKKEKGKDKKRAAAAAKAAASSAPESTSIDSAALDPSVTAAPREATDAAQAYKEDRDAADTAVRHPDAPERIKAHESDSPQESAASAAQPVDEASPTTVHTEDVAGDSPARVIALPADEPDAEPADRK
ncbi:MAG: LapA family protein [Desulfuromonas sp.]